MPATITYEYKRRCEGGGHFVTDVSLNQSSKREFVFTTDEIREAVSNLTTDEQELVARVILRLRLQGMPRAEINALFQAGPVVIQIG